ncbi:MAG TPA: DUF2252 domain-containing protein [Candidatus Binataceae bacterium]|nr:DUF2252 domain-containing protein [Candidatus Binataceae bacterium]
MAKVKLLTKEQRYQAGKSLREKCPRLSHGKVILGHGEKRDILALIEASNEGRLENLIPIRHGRMLQSPFAYFRGTALLQAHDLAGTPVSGINVHACGDCHLMNFGGFATPERNLVFDINDFDETLPAPFEWDLKRLAASFVLAARWRRFRPDQTREIAVQAVASYRESMRERAGTGVLEAWYSRITVDDLRRVSGYKDVSGRVRRKVAEAREQSHELVFHKFTAPTRGLPRIVNQPPLLYHVDKRELNERIIAPTLKRYRETLAEERRILFDRFKFIDIAIKVVGVGSVGTRCFVALFLAAPDDPLFLQIKEARRSVLERYTGHTPVPHNGQRVVIGQRLMQSASDIFLGWTRGPHGRDFYVRQLRDMKIAPDIESQTPRVMRTYAMFCGLALARAHDKAGDAAMIAGYLGGTDHFDEAIGDYAVAYADQVERDYATFLKAVRDGRLKSDLSLSRLEAALR